MIQQPYAPRQQYGYPAPGQPMPHRGPYQSPAGAQHVDAYGRPYHLEPKESTSCCTICWIVTACIVGLVTILFFLNFFGAIPFGYDDVSTSGIKPFKYAMGVTYKGPWGTKLYLEIEGRTVASHYIWFKNLVSEAKSLPAGTGTGNNLEGWKKLLGPEEMNSLVSSWLRQIPQWAETSLKPLLDRSMSNHPTYKKMKPIAQPLISMLCQLDFEKIIKLGTAKKYEKLKDYVADYLDGYIHSNRFDEFMSKAGGNYGELGLELKEKKFYKRLIAIMRRMTAAEVWGYLFGGLSEAEKSELLKNYLSKHDPSFMGDLMPLARKYGMTN